jgi:tetratricopeptide (TPR) repeat protein
VRDQQAGSHSESSHNESSGTVYGSSVQAGAIHGGVQILTAPPDVQRRIPWQLPPNTPLTDRLDVLRKLERHRTRIGEEGHPVLASLSGLGGVGKTSLALAWLHGLRARFPGGQLYADLGAQSAAGPTDPLELLGRFLRDLGVPAQQLPLTLAERASLYRSLTAERKLVVLLDDAATAAQVRPLLPGGTNVTAVTSRWRLPGLSVDGGVLVQLQPLAREAAVELLASTLADDRVEDQLDDARTLVELCAGLPLAVRVAGARLASRPSRPILTMVRALTEEHSRLEALALTDDHSVRAALDISYRNLPDEAARLYRLLGGHPGPEFAGDVATAVLLSDEGGTAEGPRQAGARAGRLLDLLHDANLLSEAGDDRHRFHDLVRLHAAEKAAEDDSAAGRASALRRIADHYVATATHAEAVIDPQHRTLHREFGPGRPLVTVDFERDAAAAGRDPAETALDWLELELPNLMALIAVARPSGIASVSWQLADAMWPLFLRRKHYEHWRTSHAEGLRAARELGDEAAECRMLTSGGVGELGTGAHEEALRMFREAAALFEKNGDALGFARTLNYQGLAHQRLGRLGQAKRLFTEAAARLPECGDRRAGALARFNLAEAALSERRPEDAVEEAAAAHGTLADEGDRYNAARAAALLGKARLEGAGPAGDGLDEAERLLSEALAVLRPVSGFETARVLESWARLAELRGSTGLARDRYRECLDLYSRANRPSHADAVRARLERLGERRPGADPGESAEVGGADGDSADGGGEGGDPDAEGREGAKGREGAEGGQDAEGGEEAEFGGR